MQIYSFSDLFCLRIMIYTCNSETLVNFNNCMFVILNSQYSNCVITYYSNI